MALRRIPTVSPIFNSITVFPLLNKNCWDFLKRVIITLLSIYLRVENIWKPTNLFLSLKPL